MQYVTYFRFYNAFSLYKKVVTSILKKSRNNEVKSILITINMY